MSRSTHWEGEPVRVWAERWGVPVVEAWTSLGSTNDRARALLGARGSLPAVVLAEEQSAGRGRSGSPWHSAPGVGLWLSLALATHGAGPPSTALPLRVGLAAARACEAASPVRIGIKWPNDLEVDGRKVGGILCEGVAGGVVVGVGLNVRQRPGDFPSELAERAGSLESASGGSVSRSRIASVLVPLLAAEGRPTGPLTPEEVGELERRDVLLGRRVWTQQAGEGTARGIAPDGALVLETVGPPGVRVVAGSVRTL